MAEEETLILKVAVQEEVVKTLETDAVQKIIQMKDAIQKIQIELLLQKVIKKEIAPINLKNINQRHFLQIPHHLGNVPVVGLAVQFLRAAWHM